jgi:hypothetical protein
MKSDFEKFDVPVDWTASNALPKLTLLTEVKPFKTEISISPAVFNALGTLSAKKSRKCLEALLEIFVERHSRFSQKHFWNVFDEITSSDASVRWVVAHEIAHKTIRSRTRPAGPLSLENYGAVIDGQHRRVSYDAPTANLSARKIRTIVEIALDELDRFDGAQTDFDVFQLVRGSLTREVQQRIRWKATCSLKTVDQTPPSTREWALSFVFRTGNPPPRSGRSCPAERWAIVAITHARREDYVEIQGQKISRDLRYTICARRARTHFRRGTQSHANRRGGWQPAGYRRARPHYSLAQCA